MFEKAKIWWTALDSGWKFLMAATAIVTTISTVAIKVNKGIELMSDTASTVKEIKHGYDSLRNDVNDIKLNLSKEIKLRSAQDESYVDHLKLENRLDEIIKHYERMARIQDNEKKNLIP